MFTLAIGFESEELLNKRLILSTGGCVAHCDAR